MLDRSAVARSLRDRLSAEIVALRGRDAARLPPGPWADTLRIAQDLGADSLEIMALAGAVNELFHIHDTGTEDMLLARRRFGDWVDLAFHACQAPSARVSFRSSGSTGSPKRCTHALHSLAEEAAEHLRRLAPGRIFAAVPAHHIYGFIFTALMPSLAGCQVVDMRDHLPPGSGFRADDMIVSFPDHWRYLACSYPRLPSVTGVTSAAPMPAGLARTVSALGVRLIEIYGASETAGIAWRDAPDAPFVLLDRWQLAGAPASQGVLRLIGGNGEHAQTPDDVAMAGSRSFHLLGRVDGAVQVGGINVYPARIAAMLQSHDLIASARVQLAGPEHGGRLSAVLVPKDQAADPIKLRGVMEAWIAANLSPPEQPRLLIFQNEPQEQSNANWKTGFGPAAISLKPEQPKE